MDMMTRRQNDFTKTRMKKRIKKLIKRDWMYRMHAKRYCFASNILIDYKNNEQEEGS